MSHRSDLIGLFVLLTVSLGMAGCITATKPEYKALQTFQDNLKDGSLGPAMVVVPAGRFIMGYSPGSARHFEAEKLRHPVAIGKPFAIARYELTFEEYDRFAKATGRALPDDKGWGTRRWGRGRVPVFNVSWDDAKAYVQWLSGQTGKHYRLPSEAEWEYAARAGTATAFNTGSCISTDQANFHGHDKFGDCPVPGVYLGKVVPVGNYEPNAWGLYDVHGNIFEWTNDCWHDSYAGAPDDGSAWMNEGENVNCDLHVLRGGSWSGRPVDLRSGFRAKNQATVKTIFIGFRVARELD